MTRVLDGAAITALTHVRYDVGDGVLVVGTSDGRLFQADADFPSRANWVEIPSPVRDASRGDLPDVPPDMDLLTVGTIICAALDGFVSVGPVIEANRTKGHIVAMLIVNDEPAAPFVFRFKDGSGHKPASSVEYARLKNREGNVYSTTSARVDEEGERIVYTAETHPRYVGRLGAGVSVTDLDDERADRERLRRETVADETPRYAMGSDNMDEPFPLNAAAEREVERARTDAREAFRRPDEYPPTEAD